MSLSPNPSQQSNEPTLQVFWDGGETPLKNSETQRIGSRLSALTFALGVSLFSWLGYSAVDLVRQPSKVNGYFEIRALDEQGHPVAGAKVRSGETLLGITDSFGEWRKFQPVRRGASIQLSFSKRRESGELSGVHTFVIPSDPSEADDKPVIRSSVRLSSKKRTSLAP